MTSSGRSLDEILSEENNYYKLAQKAKAKSTGEPAENLLPVYTASKLHHAPMWVRLMEEWPEINFTARWPHLHVNSLGLPRWPEDSPAHGQLFWEHDVQDVSYASVVLCYAERTEVLRGALVEAGMALGQGKHVIVVGENESYGTWQYHRNVLRVKDLSSARNLLHLLSC